MSKGLYLRLLPEGPVCEPERDLPALADLIVECGRSLSGVVARKSSEPHPRGGYSLFLTCTPEQREEIVLFFRERGWLAVI